MSTPGFIGSRWYRQLAVYLSMVALAVACVLWANHVADQNNRQWCGVLRIYHDAYSTNPEPPTQLGKDLKAQMEQLYTDFHCATVRKP